MGKFSIIHGDITKQRVDAIVNAANTELAMGGGVCGAIFSAAGARELEAACAGLGPIKTGEAVITPGFGLPAKYVIHTAGPVYEGGSRGEEELLRACYMNSLKLAVENRCESIAFPLISSGIYGYPKAEAVRVATTAIRDFLDESEDDIYAALVVFGKEAFEVSGELLGEVRSYIDEHYVDDSAMAFLRLPEAEEPARVSKSVMGLRQSLSDAVGELDEPFSRTLMRLIDATGKEDPEIYKRANIDRKLFSKIRSNAYYMPSKPTVLAFAVALELTLDQTADLLKRAGFALSHSQKFDVIVEYFIAKREYDVFRINEALFSFDQQLLGGQR